MAKIGNMLWRIGAMLDFDQQLAWTRAAGFDGVGFHASAGIPGKWRGVEPLACSAKERQRLRQKMEELLNPDRVSPEGMRRSAEKARRCFREVRTG